MNKLIIGLVLLMTASAYGGLTISGSPAPNITAGTIVGTSASIPVVGVNTIIVTNGLTVSGGTTTTVLNVSGAVTAPYINQNTMIDRKTSDGFNSSWVYTLGASGWSKITAAIPPYTSLTDICNLGGGELLIGTSSQQPQTNAVTAKSYDYGRTWTVSAALGQTVQA
jgi:hypothetical protein